MEEIEALPTITELITKKSLNNYPEKKLLS